MSYSPEVYTEIKNEYERRRLAVRTEQEQRIGEVRRAVPGMEELEQVLGATGMRIMNALKEKDGGKAFSAVRKETEALVKKREALLEVHGYPKDYCDPRFQCALCGDTGYIEGKMCPCLRDALFAAQAKLSGLGKLLESQRFENFSLKYYPDQQEAGEILSCCRHFADICVSEGANLLLMGGTGLGKTHLSTAIAYQVMRSFHSVIYESAPNIMADFQYERFERGFGDGSPVRTEKYFGADLLIIDDLGSELVNQFTVSTLYNLINTRLVNRRAILINTNLSPKEMSALYDSRIISRILGEFTVLSLSGQDIRRQKLAEAD